MRSPRSAVLALLLTVLALVGWTAVATAGTASDARPTATAAQAEEDDEEVVLDDELPDECEEEDPEALEPIDETLPIFDPDEPGEDEEEEVGEEDGFETVCEDEEEDEVVAEDDEDEVDDTLDELLADDEVDAGYLDVPGAATLELEALLGTPARGSRAVAAKKAATKPVVLGTRTVTVRRAGQVKVRLALTKKGRAALKAQKQAFKVTVRVTVRRKSGARVVKARTLSFKAPKRKPAASKQKKPAKAKA